MSFFRKAGSDSESSDESEEELLSSGDESGSDQGLGASAKAAAKAPAASKSKPSTGSKFMRGADSDSSDESESESESESDSDDSEDGGKQDGAAGPAKKTLGSKFLKGGASDSDDSSDMSDSDDEDTVKVVKSAKSKRQDEMEATEKAIFNAERIGDWGSVNSEYDKLARLAAPLPGSTSSLLAPVYLRVVTSLEESLGKTPTTGANEKSGKKKQMNATAAKALTAVKQKVKKAVRENDSMLKEYKEDPEAFTKRYEGGPAAGIAAAPKKVKKLSSSAAAGAEDDDDFMTVGKGGKALAFGAGGEGVFKNLQIIMEARGKKNTDRSDQLKALNRLYTESCSTVYAKVRVLLILVSSYFDYAASGGSGAVGATGSSSGYMPIEAWTSARERINELIDILRTNNAYIVQEVVKEDYDDLVERQPNENGEKDIVYIRGNLTSLVERLDDEFFKSLQAIDPHSEEYVERLKDEKLVYNSVCLVSHYFESLKGKTLLEKGLDGESPLSRTLLRRLEHIYSKPDIVVGALEAALADNTSSSFYPEKATAATSPALTRSICVYLYKNAGSRIRLRAMLCHIYHCALHDDYYTARNMFNMSNVQADVPYADVETQGLFNRTLVQLGLSAFRIGLVEDCESTLREILQTQRVKELLLQGLPMFASSRAHSFHLTPEQEKIEKSRQLPFHMHINLELLECTYLVASMLIEVPQLAKEDLQSSSEFNRKQVSSRIFRRMLDHSDRQTFVGPPENKRDHVIQASKALLAGDWKRSTELINSIKVWSLMPNEKAIKEMLARKIQEQALRTYLFTSARFYTNVSLEHLATTLALPVATVTPIVSRMIWEEEIAGSLDQSTAILSLQKAERTVLQVHSLELLERAENMIRLLGHSRPGQGSGMDDGGDGKFGGGNNEGGHGGQRRGGNNGERRRGGGYRGGRGRGAGQFSGPIRAM